MRDLDELFAALGRSAFRRKFRLVEKEQAILRTRGLRGVLEEARAIIAQRLAPAVISNDGRQTPWRNHPVFVAQHATGTCCRKCLAKWHGIEAGRSLSDAEREYVIRVIERYLRDQGADDAPPAQGELFA